MLHPLSFIVFISTERRGVNYFAAFNLRNYLSKLKINQKNPLDNKLICNLNIKNRPEDSFL
jgi:hypothetical protein